jgi:hypothetical protein
VTPNAPPDAMRAVASVKRRSRRKGETVETETEIRLWPKVEALDRLARHLGLYRDGPQATATVTIDWATRVPPRADPVEERIRAAEQAKGGADAGTVP